MLTDPRSQRRSHTGANHHRESGTIGNSGGNLLPPSSPHPAQSPLRPTVVRATLPERKDV